MRLSTTLSDLPTYTRYVLIVTHHAPFRAPGDWTFLLPWRGGGLLKTLERIKDFAFLSHAAHEARDLLAVVSGAADLRQDVQFVMFCGHRHQPNVGRAGRVLVVEGGALAETDPSTCLVFADGPSLYIQRAKVGAAAVRV